MHQRKICLVPAAIASPKDKHLQKTPPPSLGSRQGDPVNPGNIITTDPNLKRFKDAGRPGGGNKVLITLVSILLVIIVFLALVVFVPVVRAAIRPYLPESLQSFLNDSPQRRDADTTATSPE